jgi:toxin ParE1/3/4
VRLRLSNQAQSDLIEIGEYTVRTWSAAQAEAYVGGLIRHMEALAAGAARGRPLEHLPPDWRRATYRSHHICYGETGDVLLVHRILHQRRNMGSALAADLPDET